MMIPYHRRAARVLASTIAITSMLAIGSAAHTQATTTIDTSTQKESGFSNGQLTPFVIESVTTNGNYVHPFTKNGEPALKTYWAQANYKTDQRRTISAEAGAPGLDVYGDGWFAFQFMLPASYPSNKQAAIAQMFNKGCGSWMLLLRVIDNELRLSRRTGTGCGPWVETVISDNIVRDAWKSIIFHWKVSRSNQGELQVWYANESTPRLNVTGINIGGGTFTGDTLEPVDGNGIAARFGQYAFDKANFTPGEERIVYYDNVSVLRGNPSNAYSLVKPF